MSYYTGKLRFSKNHDSGQEKNVLFFASSTSPQGQKLITVNFAKFRGTATSKVTKFHGKNHGFHNNFTFQIANFTVKLQISQ